MVTIPSLKAVLSCIKWPRPDIPLHSFPGVMRFLAPTSTRYRRKNACCPTSPALSIRSAPTAAALQNHTLTADVQTWLKDIWFCISQATNFCPSCWDLRVGKKWKSATKDIERGRKKKKKSDWNKYNTSQEKNKPANNCQLSLCVHFSLFPTYCNKIEPLSGDCLESSRWIIYSVRGPGERGTPE